MTLRKRKESINAAYFQYFLHAFDVHKCFYGMGDGVRQSLSYDGIRRLTLVVPTESEQEQIVRFLNYKTRQINQLIHSKKDKIELSVEFLKKVFEDAITKSTRRIKLKKIS